MSVQAYGADNEEDLAMTTMTVLAGHSTRSIRPARSVHWTAPRPRRAGGVDRRHLVWAADAAMRFGLALVPFSALCWMFIAR